MTTYEERGYGARPVGFGEKPGIAVVDFQRVFADPAFPTGGAPLVRRAVENTARLLKVARAAGVPVAACYMAYHSERDAPYWKAKGIAELRDGHPGCELDPLIAGPTYDYLLRKSAPSIFFNTPAAAFSRRTAATPSSSQAASRRAACAQASWTPSASVSAPSCRRIASAIRSRRRTTRTCATSTGATPTS